MVVLALAVLAHTVWFVGLAVLGWTGCRKSFYLALLISTAAKMPQAKGSPAVADIEEDPDTVGVRTLKWPHGHQFRAT